MNILFYMHQFPGIGGMESVAATLAGELSRRGHAVFILSHKSGLAKSMMSQLPGAAACYKMPDKTHLVSAQNRGYVKRLVGEMHINIIMFMDSYAEIQKNIFGCNIGAKIITSEHSCPFYCTTEEHPERFTFPCRLRQAIRHGRIHLPYYYEGKRKRYLYDKSDRYVLLSDRFYGEFKAMANLLDSRKLRAIPNPISPYIVPEAVNWSKKERLMIFVGTLSEAKGAMRAIVALDILKQRNLLPDGWRVEVLGDGPEHMTCEQYIAERGLDFVRLVGYVEDPRPFYEKAKLLLFPSAREGFGMTLVEAMSNGCVPVAFASYSSVFDIIHHEKNGVLVDAFDIEKYAMSVHSLLTEEKILAEMSREAVKISDKFAIEKIVDLWETLMDEVLQNA